MACQNYFTHFELSQLLGGTKTGDPREKTPGHPQAELGLYHMWPELGLNPQPWDDKRFRAPKISSLNHSATWNRNEPPDKTNKMTCVPSKDSDQPGHPPSLIRVFAVSMKKSWFLNFLLSAQWRLGECPGWFESSLSTQVILLVLSWGGSNYIYMHQAQNAMLLNSCNWSMKTSEYYF